jgi:ATP-dependent RNA helicase RhlB
MRQTEGQRVLVFANMRVTCDRLGRILKQQGYATAVLSGDVPQKKREQLLKAFTEGKRNVLVATDVAARGLHIPSVSHVFNYDLPQDAEDYVHRIGRTARAGASGNAISFACEDHAFSLMDIEEYIGHALTKQEISDAVLESPKQNTDSSTDSKDKKREPNRKPKARSGSPTNKTPTQKATTNNHSEKERAAKPARSHTPAPQALSDSPLDAAVPTHTPRGRYRPKVEVPAVG